MVLAQSLKVILSGVVAGVCCSLWLNGLMRSLLYGVSPVDPRPYGLAIGFLVVVGLSASYLPARQASIIDPASTLRLE
jgi:putative ABC transport system permease protein